MCNRRLHSFLAVGRNDGSSAGGRGSTGEEMPVDAVMVVWPG